MSNLLSAIQMRDADAYTIEHKPISSINLMERAAQEFVKVLKKKYPNKLMSFSILCGQGNNGGDGLAIARLLHNGGYKNILVYLIDFGFKQSKDYARNLKRLNRIKIQSKRITEPAQFEDNDSCHGHESLARAADMTSRTRMAPSSRTR